MDKVVGVRHVAEMALGCLWSRNRLLAPAFAGPWYWSAFVRIHRLRVLAVRVPGLVWAKTWLRYSSRATLIPINGVILPKLFFTDFVVFEFFAEVLRLIEWRGLALASDLDFESGYV